MKAATKERVHVATIAALLLTLILVALALCIAASRVHILILPDVGRPRPQKAFEQIVQRSVGHWGNKAEAASAGRAGLGVIPPGYIFSAVSEAAEFPEAWLDSTARADAARAVTAWCPATNTAGPLTKAPE